MNAPTNTGVTGGQLGGYQQVASPTGPNDPRLQVPSTTMGQPPSYAPGPSTGWHVDPNFDRIPGITPQVGPGVPLTGPPQQGGGGGDYQSEFMDAVQQLGIAPQQLRGNPQLMDKVTTFLNQKYPGQNWANGGQRAGDWFSVNGQGFDVLPAGDSHYQWLSDPANSTAGAGGNLPGGYYTGLQYGGGMYPLASAGGPGLATPWTTPFNAPTDITEQNDPGFQARMKMGTDAIQRSAAAKGTLLTGGLLKGLDRYAQDYASNEYNNVYNRALGQYQMAYDIFNGNNNTLFNRLGALSNIGENAAAATGSLYQDIGNSQAAGTVGSGNAWSNTIGGITNAISKYPWGQPKPQTTTPTIYSNPQEIPSDPAGGAP